MTTDHIASENHPSVAPAKPPRTYESDMEQSENVEPVVSEVIQAGQNTTKRHAPPPPQNLSPLHTSTPRRDVPSPGKMMKVDDDVGSLKDESESVETRITPDVNKIIDGEGSEAENDSGDKFVNGVAAKTTTNGTGHVSSATLIFGASTSAAVTKSASTKVAVIQKPNPSGSEQPAAVKAVSHSTADDSMADEPTRQPVAARLAAWQTKQAAPTNQEPLAIASRVKNYERKIAAESITEKAAKTPLKPRSQADPASNKSTVLSAKMSPVRAGGPAASVGSPVKSVLSSPKKLSPATRAIHERLTQICEAGTRNEAVDHQRNERAAELASVEKRWQTSPTNDSLTVRLFH